VNQVVELVEPRIRDKWGVPFLPSPRWGEGGERSEPGEGQPFQEPLTPSPSPQRGEGDRSCRYAILGFGKLGGREISYHSDLDLLLVYEADGETSTSATTNAYYFTELAQRVIRMLSAIGPMGRLYSVDMRLRPTGKSGALVLPVSEFERYFATGASQLWERQALSRARVVRGDAAFGEAVMERVRAALLGESALPGAAVEVRRMREKLEASASPRSLKRGRGGLTDVEFLVQLLQIECGRKHPDILRPNMWEALDAIAAAGLLPLDDAAALRNGYSFLRLVEARLRIVTDRPLTEVPDNSADLAKLARRLGFDSPERFLILLGETRDAIRAIYDRQTGERSVPPRG
jgi:glutamate-ammonia-ligase adenylyltransferase